MKNALRASVLGGGVVVLAGAVWLSVAFFQARSSTDSVTPGPAVIRRLTAEQYQNIVRDVFGGDIDLGGRFEPDVRVDGLLAVGAGQVSVTAAGMEQYDAMGRAVASQALDQNHRDMLLACKPAAAEQPDDACDFRRHSAAYYQRINECWPASINVPSGRTN